MTDFGKYKIHPFAARFPLITGDQFVELVNDIKTNGQLEPIATTYDEKVLVDGRNRYLACIEARVDPVFRKLGKHYTELDIIKFIFSKNMARRHLNPGQRAIMALEAAPELERLAKERQIDHGKTAPGKKKTLLANSPEVFEEATTRDQLAALANVGTNTIGHAKKVMEFAKDKDSPELIEKIMTGEKTLNEVYEEIPEETRAKRKSPKKTGPVITLKTHTGEEIPYQAPIGEATFNKTNEQVSWAAWTWNPVTGCLHGCKYCYAREIANAKKMADAYPVGFTPLFHYERLDAPANTTVPEEAKKDPRLKRVFVCSMADLYGKWVPDEWIEKVHASCIENPQWDYLMLTKFPRRYVDLKLPETAWLGTSVDEQKRVRLAEDAFRQIKGVRVKWLSLEPLLAPLEFSDLSMFDWIVIGSQSATKQPDGPVPEFAPPFEWVARLVAQAREAKCRVYLKPNLNGVVNSQSAGMDLPQEEPLITNPKLRLIA